MKNIGDGTKQSSNDFTLFISDLHLCASRPHITTEFLDFLKTTASQARALYILGDLFEYWAGDDDVDDAHTQSIITGLRVLSESGVSTYFMRGNRDFLLGEIFCNATKISLLQDPTLIDLYGNRVLLSHGDVLCTDDKAYQAFRQQVRDPAWQKGFLMQPLHARKQQIENIRLRSEQEKSQKSAQIMDVNQPSVEEFLMRFDYPELLIHGHTHRPKTHSLVIDQHNITRWVLGDWYEQGSYLVCDKLGCNMIPLAVSGSSL